MPYTLAENAGLQPVEIVTQLRAAHAAGEKFAGIDVKPLGIARPIVYVQPIIVYIWYTYGCIYRL